ncbi:MAG: AzlC family ABC transporter permease [Firmicutes bacterium]|nr:AzlC family ABC transporter permease [Bacillota bacterium]
MYNRRLTMRRAFVASIPVMAGYIVLGIGFGILLNSRGYGLIWAFAMSTIIFAGSLQYVAVDLLAGGASLITTALTSLMVNARHLFYAVAMVDTYKKAGREKPYLIYALTDETYSLVCTIDTDEFPEGVDKMKYCFWLTLMNQSYWVLGSCLGSALGSVLSFDFAGIDFAMTALFVAVFVEQWISSKNHACAITGIVVSLICLALFGPDNFLIPTMILITTALVVEQKLGVFGREGADE